MNRFLTRAVILFFLCLAIAFGVAAGLDTGRTKRGIEASPVDPIATSPVKPR
jgi:hypothetical protein